MTTIATNGATHGATHGSNDTASSPRKKVTLPGPATSRRGPTPPAPPVTTVVTPYAVEEPRPDESAIDPRALLLVLWHIGLTVLAVWIVLGAFPLADRITDQTPRIRAHWFGPDFTLTATGISLVLAAVAGLAGSLIHTIAILSSRLGRHTFESSYTAWYVLRPFEAVLLALLFVAALRAGQISLVDTTFVAASPMMAFLAGGLAGLFSDRVLQMLRATLGATSTELPAKEQRQPHTVPPVLRPDIDPAPLPDQAAVA